MQRSKTCNISLCTSTPLHFKVAGNRSTSAKLLSTPASMFLKSKTHHKKMSVIAVKPPKCQAAYQGLFTKTQGPGALMMFSSWTLTGEDHH